MTYLSVVVQCFRHRAGEELSQRAHWCRVDDGEVLRRRTGNERQRMQSFHQAIAAETYPDLLHEGRHVALQFRVNVPCTVVRGMKIT